MINGLGVLGWGVGGIEAEAAMLGQPMSMLIPQVLGFRLHGELPEGATATDLVLTVTQMLRERGVVGMFVEFYGAGLAGLPIADRATIGNMSPEFGSTCAIFPIDAETLSYLELSGRSRRADRARRGLRQGAGPVARRALRSSRRSRTTIELDLGTVEPSLAGPKRPQDRVALSDAKSAFGEALRRLRAQRRRAGRRHDEAVAESYPATDPPANGAPGHEPPPSGARLATAAGARARRRSSGRRAATPVTLDGESFELDHGHVVIAAITSCTNTSNPSVMIGAGILARNARRARAALQAVGQDLAGARLEGRHRVPRPRRPHRAAGAARLQPRRLRLHHLHRQLRAAAPRRSPRRSATRDLAVVSVLSGNRNFEGRINPDVKMNYLASPPLCVAYALAGTMDIDIVGEPLGQDEQGEDVYLRDIWPSAHEIAQTIGEAVRADMFRQSYGEVFAGDERWNGLPVPDGRALRLGRGLHLRAPAALLPGHARRAARR